MEKWLKLFERLVTALEKIADNSNTIPIPITESDSSIPISENFKIGGSGDSPEEQQAEESRSPGSPVPSEAEQLEAADRFATEGHVPSSEDTPTGGPEKENPVPRDREVLKKDLRDRGITFKDSARTATLQKLWEDSQPPIENDGSKSEEPPINESIENPFGVEEPPAEEIPQDDKTKDDLRDALVHLASKKGHDVAIQFMRDFGDSANHIDQVPPAYYTRMVNKIYDENPK